MGARLGVDGAEGYQNRAPPQLGADGTPAVQGYPLQLPLVTVPWPSGNNMAGPGSPATPAVRKWEKDEDLFFFPLVIKESLSTERKSTNDASSGII